MSRKDTNNIRSLLLQILFVFVFCTVLICYGLATRPNSLAVYAPPKGFYTRLAETSSVTAMSKALIEVSISLDALCNELQMQREKEAQLESPATLVELYDSYVYEIIETRYPSLDPQLVRAIIYRESRYNAESVNAKTNAIGLMQLSPKWQTGRAESLGVTDLTDPYGNILTGCDFLNDLLATYSYNYALDLYAGGYPYANSNKGGTSNYVRAVKNIMNGLSDGTIIPGGG